MISEMLQTSRWFYVKEPAFPDVPRRRNSWYRKRALYTEIIGVVKGSPGIPTGEVARKLGRPYDYISPPLFHLKKFGSLRYEPAGVERMEGLAAFAGVLCVRQMLSKLSSEKTKGPWLRRLFRYQEWLIGKGYFGSMTEALEDCRRAATEGRYRQRSAARAGITTVIWRVFSTVEVFARNSPSIPLLVDSSPDGSVIHQCPSHSSTKALKVYCIS